MESSGATCFTRNRSSSAILHSAINDAPTPAEAQPKEAEAPASEVQGWNGDAYVEDESWIAVLVYWLRILTCFVVMVVLFFMRSTVLLFLLPWPRARTHQANIYCRQTAKLVMWILRNPIRIEGTEFSNTKGIYISNHASPIDAFLFMYLLPIDTVGLAKKEVIYYPFIGLMYVFLNHRLIDRSNTAAAIKSLKEAAGSILKNNWSLAMFPEGTRSRDGRLLPFKKGFIHLALETRLPIVPMVLIGTHRAWRTGTLRIRPAPIVVKYLPPIKTDEWTKDKVGEYMEMIHDLFDRHLPESQRPLNLAHPKSQ